ncbi:hypothetical protein L3X38_017220 [Prunus dulcis]|uniref:Uncharacterized protein n=1 Tax=Prunus dulcis TaxID=3755 RepID=A0AAD4W6X3_PRUDU|nr:hypothetical protein L3X38_017220 [Prunus dulcis]
MIYLQDKRSVLSNPSSKRKVDVKSSRNRAAASLAKDAFYRRLKAFFPHLPNFKCLFETLSFVAETFIFLYVGMDALDIEKWRFISDRPGTSVVDEKIEPVYEILPASTLVLHQSPAEEVIQVTSFPETDNTNKISHDDLILEGTKPTYQLPERKNRGKPRV